MLNTRPRPARDIEAPEAEETVDHKHNAETDNKNAERMHRLIGNDPVIDLKNHDRHCQRQNILRAGSCQKFGAVPPHRVEFR